MPPTILNHKARRDYFIDETYEAGIELKGPEVKSLRAGRAAIDDAFGRLERGDIWLYNCHIAPFEQANRWNVEPLRPRRLLLRKPELEKLRKGTREKGMTIVPTRVYLKGSYIKVEIALAKGKKQHDKRHDIKDRDARREMDRALR